MSVASRKLQKLGLKSLVVTLPRGWVKRHKLEAGDSIFIVEEPDRLVILPPRKDEESSPATMSIDLDNLVGEKPEALRDEVRRVVTCSSMLGIDSFILRSRKVKVEEVYNALREAGVLSAGIDADSSSGVIKVANIIDVSRIDARVAIKGFSQVLSSLIDVFIGLIKDFIKPEEAEARLRDLHKEAMNLERLTIRSIIEPRPSLNSFEVRISYSILSSASLLPLIEDAIIAESRRMIKTGEKPDSHISSLIEELKNLLSQVIMTLATPSISRSRHLLSTVSSMEDRINSMLISEKEPVNVRILATIYYILRILRIQLLTAFCLSLPKQNT